MPAQPNLPEDYQVVFEVFNSEGHDTREFEPRSRYLKLADIALLNEAREHQSRIKEKIRPHVERYRKITGNKR
jgi:hypothetical protein